MRTGRRWFNNVCIPIVALLALTLFSFSDVSAAQKTTSDITKPESDMLQFKAGNHILGFAPDRAYLVSMDHALSVQFLGIKGVMPKADSTALATGAADKASSLGKVVYQNLWEGISLTYIAAKEGITESTYHVAPGADVANIRLKYNVPIEKQKDGSLKFKFATGSITESAPVAWQDTDGKRLPVEVAFSIKDGTVGFEVGKYDNTRPLTIDPTYSWNTFYGAVGGSVYGTGISVDGSGNVYITGYSSASWNGPGSCTVAGTPPCPLHSNGNNFVLKLDSSGAYQWHTFYGGTSSSSDAGIAVDGSGNVYVTGYSYSTWGTPVNAFSGGYDIFVLKLNSNGALIWNTFHGSSGYELGHGIAVDGSSNVYVTGQSGATWGAPLHPYNGGWYNLFVLKLDSSGAYQWHTFYGSSNSGDLDYGNSIALDHSGNIYVAGKSDSTWGSPLHPHSAGDPNVFILKLDNNGTYLWHTFYGISSTNYGVGLALDSDSNIYVTSTSAAWGIPLHDYSGNWDIFVLKLDSAGAYKWHTFYGSAGNDDFGYGIAVDGSGNVYVTGTSQGNWGSPLSAYSGNADFFLLKLNSSGTYQWHSFYGSGNDDWGWGVAVDTSGKVYVTGGSNATWGTPIHSFIGNESVFVLKLDDLAGSARVLSGGLPISSYSKLQDAYNAATDGDTIQAQTMVFTESLTFVANINVLLKGGYNYDFLLNPLMTTVKGVLTIGGGTVTLENLIIN